MALEKTNLRKFYRKLRKSSDTKEESGQMLLHNCITNLTFCDSDIVSGYIPIDGEINILPLMQHLSGRSINVLVPATEEGKRMLQFKKWSSSSNELGETMVPNILFIPLVAFDRKLNRLGFGGGYYDYTIEALRQRVGCKCIGVAYDIQLCDSVPVEPHDQKLDMVITDKEVYS